MPDLLALPGVARKTANVVLGNAFGINIGVVVDTHVSRISQRFGLTRETDPKKIEPDLMALFPRPSWCLLSHLLIFHGRRACKARGATCTEDAICRRYCSNARSD
jgi:endonuclease-3